MSKIIRKEIYNGLYFNDWKIEKTLEFYMFPALLLFPKGKIKPKDKCRVQVVIKEYEVEKHHFKSPQWWREYNQRPQRREYRERYMFIYNAEYRRGLRRR